MIAIEIFSKPNCFPCKLTKRWLDERGIPYEEYPATDHLDALREQGIRSAPGVFAYRDGIFQAAWGGYNPDQLETHTAQQIGA